ncbi:MAG: energy transducer TonB [Nitrospirae bacterium]|nr:energy transducer TonB [Nitrospirota bacterium]MCL5284834.1 energy transducer TonB [Nitrospirota bacterium]
MKPDFFENPAIRLYGLLGLVMAMETALLLFIHISPETVVPDRPEIIRVSLVHPPPPQPKPIPKPAKPKPHPVLKKVSKPVPPKPVVLPKATATSTNLLAAEVGNRVSLGWGESTPVKGKPSDYTPPELVTKVDTDALYTAKMKDSDEEGDVVIEVWIDTKGHIARTKMVIPSVYDDLNNAATGVLKKLRFRAATYKGQPVEGKFQLNFRFRIRNS